MRHHFLLWKCVLVVILTVLFAGQSWAASFLSSTGHYYEFVGFDLPQTNGLTWEEAKSAAEGRQGYLATITSAEENTFIDSLLPERISGYGLTSAWLGGKQTSYKSWSWATGPENGEQFFHLSDDNIYRINDMYTNWSSDPNRPVFSSDLPYLLMNSKDWYTRGLWDNASATYRSGYVVEYDNNPVPIPATLPLLASGLGILGFALRRKTR
jgi:hypothetical protein